MLAVLGLPKLLSSFFDIRERRRDRRENEEHRRANEEGRREEAAQLREKAECRRVDEERRREERHQEMMTLLAALVGNSSDQTPEQTGVIRSRQQIIDRLASENDRPR